MMEIHNQLASSFMPAPTATEEAGPTVDVLSSPAKAKLESSADLAESAGREVPDHDDLFLDELIVLAGDLADNHSAVSSSSQSSSTTMNLSLTLPSSSSNMSTISPANANDTPATTDHSTDANEKKRKVTPRNAAAESKALQRELAKRAKAEAAKVSSIFASGQSIVFSEDAQVFADKPLAEILHLKYKGTFGVYLDANNKIFRYEFIYTALDDAASTEETLNAPEETVEGGYNENQTNEEED